MYWPIEYGKIASGVCIAGLAPSPSCRVLFSLLTHGPGVVTPSAISK